MPRFMRKASFDFKFFLLFLEASSQPLRVARAGREERTPRLRTEVPQSGGTGRADGEYTQEVQLYVLETQGGAL